MLLDIFNTKYDDNDKKHLKLAALGEAAHERVATFLMTIDKAKKVEGLQWAKFVWT
jgi:hypothetical protein